MDEIRLHSERMGKASTHDASLEELEALYAVAAYAVSAFGPKYAKILERMEKEVELARQEDPVVKARRVLDAYTRDGGVNAIFSKRSFLKESV